MLKNLTVNRVHKLLLNITTPDGKSNSSVYSWFIGKHWSPFCTFIPGKHLCQPKSIWLMNHTMLSNRYWHHKKKENPKTILSNILLESKTILVSYLTDTIPPTATIFSHQSYMDAPKLSIDVIFSEACPGHGGFKCVNSSNCDVSWSLTQQLVLPSCSCMVDTGRCILNFITSMKRCSIL